MKSIKKRFFYFLNSNKIREERIKKKEALEMEWKALYTYFAKNMVYLEKEISRLEYELYPVLIREENIESCANLSNLIAIYDYVYQKNKERLETLEKFLPGTLPLLNYSKSGFTNLEHPGLNYGNLQNLVAEPTARWYKHLYYDEVDGKFTVQGRKVYEEFKMKLEVQKERSKTNMTMLEAAFEEYYTSVEKNRRNETLEEVL